MTSIDRRSGISKKFTKVPQEDVAFLKNQGLLPHHTVLDIGCAGGRIGYEVIRYLNKGNYYGFDKEKHYVQEFKKQVRINNTLEEKLPNIFKSDFEWQINEDIKFDYVFAFSVFTHVSPSLIKDCLNNLRKHIDSSSRFYATLFIQDDNEYDLGKKHKTRKGEFRSAYYSLDYFDSILFSCGYQRLSISGMESVPVLCDTCQQEMVLMGCK
tara:strand:+ start:126 stop:758 length:633 start_codon:yes stop_codon:yes gene_type:complete